MTAFTILTVLHDSREDLARLLDSLERHLDPVPRIVVVDAASRDGGAELAHERGADVLELVENPGFGVANNLGLARVATPLTVLLNPDVELLDGTLPRWDDAARALRALLAEAAR